MQTLFQEEIDTTDTASSDARVKKVHDKSGGSEEYKTHTWPNIFNLNQRRANACFETAKRFVMAVYEYRSGGKDQLLLAMREEKRRILKFSLSLIASSIQQDMVRQSFIAGGLLGKESPGDECEAYMLVTGTSLAQRNVHPLTIMRAMTAYLGFSYFAATEEWLTQKFGARVPDTEELIIPGELPDAIAFSDKSPGPLVQAVRLAGLQLLAAALAGCPKETSQTIKALAFNPLGSIILEDEMENARNRLSSDELSDAQHAFLELIGSLKDFASMMEMEEESWKQSRDEGLTGEISELILELDSRVLRSVASSLDPRLVASLIQTMEPIAHDRLFTCIGSNKGKKILDALEASTALNSNELTRRAQTFAQKVLAEIAPKSKTLGRSFPLPARVRQLLSAILSRE
jgi:hypothetical protein